MLATDFIATLVVNKNTNNPSADAIASIFKNNWHEPFLFDAPSARTLSYCDVLSAVVSCSRALKERGLKSGDTICPMMENSLDLVILYLSALANGLVVAPIDPRRGKTDIQQILAQLPRKTVIKEFADSLYDGSSASIDDLILFRMMRLEDLFLVTFTSGSTGVPKGVKHSMENLLASARAFGSRFGFNRTSVFYHNLPMTYMAGILNLIFLPLIFGSKIVIGPRFGIENAATFWNYPIQYGCNVFWFTPTIISLLLELDRDSRGSSYTQSHSLIGCVGTAPLPMKKKNAFEERYEITLYESYGLSETLFVSTNDPRCPYKEGSVGSMLDGVILDRGRDGEIMINVPWMFLGYTGKEKAFVHDRWFPSGDLGELDERRLLTITGRKKDLIIRGGINISPKAIEIIIDRFDRFKESVVIGLPDDIMGEKIVCFFVPMGRTVDNEVLSKLRATVVSELGASHGIDQFVSLKELPKNVNGKIDKPYLKTYHNDRKN